MVGTGFDSQLAAARPGTVLCGKYRVERELARGGMGTVVVATHLKLDLLVAIKLLDASGKDRDYVSARFLREARAAARLSGDHVVRILDLDEAPDGTPFLVMELLNGSDLERLLAAQGKVAPARAVDWALQACAALAEAHARGIVHRDVKPANLLLLRRLDGSELIKLLDFGISKVLSDEVQLTRTAATLGSPLFMSPEQLLTPGVVGTRSDVWSLGVTLYRLLSGATPFDAADASTLAAQIAARPPAPLAEVAPQLPSALSAVVMRCLEKDAQRRWPSVVALADALEPFRDPTGLGSARGVRLGEARGQVVTERVAPVPTPHAAEPPPSWTLSHDVPRAAGSSPGLSSEPGHKPGVAPALAALPSNSGATAAPSGGAPWKPVALGLASLVLAAGVYFAATRAGDSVASTKQAGQTKPIEAPPAVATPTVEPLSPLAAQRDAGTIARIRPVKHTPEGTKDPSDLELK